MTWDEALTEFGISLARVERAVVTGEWPEEGWDWEAPTDPLGDATPEQRQLLSELMEREAKCRALVVSAQLQINEQLKETDQHRHAARSYAFSSTLR